MTPLLVELHEARKERLARFANAATALKAKKQAKVQEDQATLLEESIAEQMKKAWVYINDEPRLPAYLSINNIQSATCEHFQISLGQMLAKSRHRPVLIPRQIAMHLCGLYAKSGPSEIGRRFGDMDHSTVINACEAMGKKIRDDWKIAFDVAHIERLLA